MDLPVYMWIIIAVLAFLGGGLIVFMLAKHGGVISWKDVSLAFSSKTETDYRIKEISDYMADKMCLIRQMIFVEYLRILKTEGCSEDILVENEDSQYVDQMLGNIVFSGNGITSIKSVFEKSILNKSIFKMDYPVLILSLQNQCRVNMQKYINHHYHTNIKLTDGTYRERIVSNTEWSDSLPGLMIQLNLVIEDIVRYARSLYQEKKS